ncbi:MAG: hypothetical protein C0507_12715 [Cyanobacteria bacterium PR.3.49]|nr:hypothetical protein [Cyanobacteria bacterium PR.3.49]
MRPINTLLLLLRCSIGTEPPCAPEYAIASASCSPRQQSKRGFLLVEQHSRAEATVTLDCHSQQSFDVNDLSVKLWDEFRGLAHSQKRFPLLLPPEDCVPKSGSLSPDNVMDIPVMRVGESATQETTQIFRKSEDAARVYDKSKDAVVKITTTRDGGAVTGSGFFVEKDGTVATDYHVISGAKRIDVTTTDGRTFTAMIDKHRSTSDLAVLKVDRPGGVGEFPILPLAKTAEALKSGDKVFALGHPHGWEKVYLSSGTVDSLKSGGILGYNPQRLSVDAYVHVEPGNSGGPLLNSEGEVIGLARTTVPDATNKTTPLQQMVDTEFLKSQFTTVDDLRNLLGRSTDEANSKGYIFPSQIRVNQEQLVSTVMAAGSTFALKAGLTNKGTIWGNALLPAHAASNLANSDFRFLKNAFHDGTVAEKVNAGINVGSDLMMMAGPALYFHPRLKVVSGAVQMAGAGIRMTNDWLAGRKFD